MSETGALLADMTQRLLSRELSEAVMRSAAEGHWPADAWAAVEAQGLPLALVQGEQGFDVPIEEGLGLIRLIGRHADPTPLADTMIANALLARAGLPVAEGPVALVPAGMSIEQDGTGWRITGEADRVAWGRRASALMVEHHGRIALLANGFATLDQGCNLARMPRDRMLADGAAEAAASPGVSLIQAGALVRALLMAGAMERLVELSIAYVTERVQFGRALSAFQAVQHMLARLAGDAAAASAAADLAADAFADDSPGLDTALAAARSRIAEAAGVAIGLAHQLHGAIGFTEEHRLHWFTTALWSWRDEFGSAAWWTRRLGAQALGQSKQAYWPFVTAI